MAESSEFREILDRLQRIEETARNGKPQPIPLIDPTANVLAHVAAAVTRQDDLRVAENKLHSAELLRIDQLREKDRVCAEEIQEVHLQAQRDLASAESKRIDALTLAESRRIDALLAAASNAVALASEKSAAQAATLAQQVATSAEALRAQVATTAQGVSTQIDGMRDTFDKRITLLERALYQTGGREEQRGESRTQSQSWMALLIGLGGLIAGILLHYGGALK